MKISRILPVVGILTLLPCGAAFSQSPNQIPPGAGVGGRPAASGFPLPRTHEPFAELLAAGQRQGLAR